MTLIWLLMVFTYGFITVVKGDTRLLIDRDLIEKKDDLKFNFLRGEGSVRGRRFRTVGCWSDTWDRAIAPLEGKHALLMDRNYKIREDPLRKCAVAALENNYGMFAIENGGQCMSDMTAEYYYKRFGRGAGCRMDGYGGPWSMQVYSFSGTQDGNGGYTQWSQWTSCSKTCDKGIQERVRSCTQPLPTKWGNNCDDLGPDAETRMCGHNDCDAPTIIQAVEVPTRHEESQVIKAKEIDKVTLSEKNEELEDEEDMNDEKDSKEENKIEPMFSKPVQTNLSKLLNGEGNMKQSNSRWSMINNDQMRKKGVVYGSSNGVQQPSSIDIKQAHRLLHKKWLALKSNQHHHGVIGGTVRNNVNKAFTAFDEDDMTGDDPDAIEVNEGTKQIPVSETGRKRAPQCVCPAVNLMGKPMPNPKPCPCGFKKGILPKKNRNDSTKQDAGLTPLLSAVNEFDIPQAPATLQDGDDLSPEETTEDDDEEEEEGFENEDDDNNTEENDDTGNDITSKTSSEDDKSTTKDRSWKPIIPTTTSPNSPVTQSATLKPAVATTALISNNIPPATSLQHNPTSENGIPQQRRRKPVTNLLTNQPPSILQNKASFANLDNKILVTKQIPDVASDTMTVTMSKLTPVNHGISNLTSQPTVPNNSFKQGSLNKNNEGRPTTNVDTTTMPQLPSHPATTQQLAPNFHKETTPSITEQNLKSENDVQAQLVTMNNSNKIRNNVKNKELISNNYDNELPNNKNTEANSLDGADATKSTPLSSTNVVNNQLTTGQNTSLRGNSAKVQPFGSQLPSNKITSTEPPSAITATQTVKDVKDQSVKPTSQSLDNGGVNFQGTKPKSAQVSNNQPVNIGSIKPPSGVVPSQDEVPNKPADNSKTSALYKWLFTLSENLNKARQAGELKEGNFTVTNDIKNVLTTIEKTADQYRSEDYRKIIRKIGPSTPQVNISKEATKFKFNPQIPVHDATTKEKFNTTITNQVKNPVVSNFPSSNIISNKTQPATMIPDNVTQSNTFQTTQDKQPMQVTQPVTIQNTTQPLTTPNNFVQQQQQTNTNLVKPNTVQTTQAKQPTQITGVLPNQKPVQPISDGATKAYGSKAIKQQDLSPTSPAPKCDINLGFLLDGSASVEGSKRGNFLKMINFVKDIIHDFVKLSQPVHVGTVVYSTNTKVILGFGTKGTEEVIDRILDSVHYPGQGSMTGKALKDTYNLLFDKNVAPRQRKNVLLLLTDGPSNDDINIPSRWIKQAGVEIFTIGLGSNYDSHQLEIIASDPRKHHVMTKNYDELKTSVQDIRYRLCGYNADQILKVMSSPYFTPNDQPSNNGVVSNQCMVDVAFLLDGSRQVETNDNGNFQRQIHFVKRAMHLLPVSRDDVHVGVGLLGDSHVMVFPMNEHYTEKSLQFELDHIRYPAGDLVRLQDIKQARDIMIHRGTRDIAPSVFVLLTDISSMDSYHDAVQTLRNEGNDVILYGVSSLSWKQDIKTPSNVAGFDDQMLSLESENEEEAVKQFTINLCKIPNAKRSDIPRTRWLATQTLVNNPP